jgi:hypothetical protein
MELMQIMMNKIKITEAKCAHLEKELREKVFVNLDENIVAFVFSLFMNSKE